MKWVEEVWEEEDVRVRPEPECAAEALQQRPEEVPRVGEGERDQEQVESVPHGAVVQDEARAEVAEHADDGEDGLHASNGMGGRRGQIQSDISRSWQRHIVRTLYTLALAQSFTVRQLKVK